MTLVNAVNYCNKEIHCRCWRGPRYVCQTSYYKKFKNEQLQDTVNSVISGHHWGNDFCLLIGDVRLLESLTFFDLLLPREG